MSLERRAEAVTDREMAAIMPTMVDETKSGAQLQQPLFAIDLLKSQHREVEQLFEEFENAGEKAYRAKEKIAKTIIEKLELHTKIEEKIFYPEVSKIDKDLISEAYAEHTAAKDLIKRIIKTKPSDEMFKAQVCVLKEMIKHHVEEEENELFPQVEDKIDSRKLTDIGAKMEKLVQGGGEKKKGRSSSKKKAIRSRSRA